MCRGNVSLHRKRTRTVLEAIAHNPNYRCCLAFPHRILDVYHLFVERASTLLRDRGRFMFIVTDGTLRSPVSHRLFLDPSSAVLRLRRAWVVPARSVWKELSVRSVAHATPSGTWLRRGRYMRSKRQLEP